MKIALLQLNPIVGDISGNADLIAKAVQEARQADLAVTSELALSGYPPRDLLLNADFVERCWTLLSDLAQDLRASAPVLVGLPQPDDVLLR